MPAAAVIPAPLAYIKVAAVKKLVVGSRDRVGVLVVSPAVLPLGVSAGRRPWRLGPHLMVGFHLARPARRRVWAGVLNWMPALERGPFTLNKSECSKQAHFARTVAHGIMEEDRLPLLLVSRRQVMIKRDRRGRRYGSARGEILGP